MAARPVKPGLEFNLRITASTKGELLQVLREITDEVAGEVTSDKVHEDCTEEGIVEWTLKTCDFHN